MTDKSTFCKRGHFILSLKQMSAENFAEQGGGRRKADALQGQQRSYAEFNATDVNGFYYKIVLNIAVTSHGLCKDAQIDEFQSVDIKEA